MFGLEVDHGGECALDGLAAVDLHRHVFREEHLGLQGEGDGEEEEGEEKGAASQKVAGRCRFHKEGGVACDKTAAKVSHKPGSMLRGTLRFHSLRCAGTQKTPFFAPCVAQDSERDLYEAIGRCAFSF